MKEVTRRGFITQASVVGAAAAVVGISSMPPGASAAESKISSPASDLRINGSVPEDVGDPNRKCSFTITGGSVSELHWR